jgi:UDP-sugar transporter A1/2/3
MSRFHTQPAILPLTRSASTASTTSDDSFASDDTAVLIEKFEGTDKKSLLQKRDDMSFVLSGPCGVRISCPMRLWQGCIIAFMIAQNVMLVLMLHHVRARVQPGEAVFNSVTGVFMAEVLKVTFCLVLGTMQVGGWTNLTRWIVAQFNDANQRSASLKTAIPALLYFVQTNLLYFAIQYLSPVTYQITSQLKILTTAGFSIVMLNRHLSGRRWLALLMLMVGVAGVQYKPSASKVETDAMAMYGLAAIVLACTTSGFAGVYFEKILKAPEQMESGLFKEPTNLIANNLRLAFFSIIVAIVGLLISGQGSLLLSSDEFFQGWNVMVWGTVLVAAIGGLTVAMVVKYTDNIAKAFATSCSIVLAGVVQSALGWGALGTGVLWFASAGTVIASVLLYQWPESAQ